LNALLAAGIYPHDLNVNLCLAAVLLKREDFTGALWRAGEPPVKPRNWSIGLSMKCGWRGRPRRIRAA